MAKLVKIGKGKELVFNAGVVGTKYPWDEWFDGEVRLITKGEDYNVLTAHMFPKIKTAARKRYKVCQVSSKQTVRDEKTGKLDTTKLVDSLIIVARDMMADERIAEDRKRAEEKVRAAELAAEREAAGEPPIEEGGSDNDDAPSE